MTGSDRVIQVLVVDDSVVVRRVVVESLQGESDMRVDTAPNGRIALDKIARARPDFVLLDIEMPELDGMATLRKIRETDRSLPIVMFSTLTERGRVVTLECLAAGANDYIPKPSGAGNLRAAQDELKVELATRVRALTRRPLPKDAAPTAAERPPAPPPRQRRAGGRVDLLAIASSTGGPMALSQVLAGLPASLPVPVVIAQHMPEAFTTFLARSLDAKTALAVHEGRSGSPLRPGEVWIAPGGLHMEVRRTGGGLELVTHDGPPENSCRPAADVLFRSVAAACGENVLAVVLTGMGRDGYLGCERIRQANGQVVVQDEATSVVWGMPGFVARAGLADAVLPLEEISGEVLRRVEMLRTCAQSVPDPARSR